MAYAKKVYPRYRRSSRFRRRVRRRRYRRYGYRRRYRRARRYRPEVKRTEFRTKMSFRHNLLVWQGNHYHYVEPYFYDYFVIGVDPPDVDWPRNTINIRVGNEQGRRIGAKIRPVALRLFGTISIYPEDQDMQTNSLSNMNIPNACMVRMIVFQIRNGNNENDPQNSEFSAVNPYWVARKTVDNVSLPVAAYNGTPMDKYHPVYWFSRMFSANNPFESFGVRRENDPDRAYVVEGVREENRPYFGVYAKCPYRNGIGSYLKILKDKIYHLNPTTAPTFAFRTKTRVPYRMVWVEHPDEDNALVNNCKNPVYVVFIPIYPVGVNKAKIEIDCQGQLFYTDK